MKLTILIAFMLLSNSVIANSVDSLQTDNDVLLFLKRIDKRFTSDKYRQQQILPTATIREKLNCEGIADEWNINNWEKVDFNGDNKTDLIITSFWYGFDVFVAMDKGDNTYQLVQLSNTSQDCALWKPLKSNSEQLLLFYQRRYGYNDPMKRIGFKLTSRIDTLVYKYGGFIEKQEASASYEVSEIEYHTVGAWLPISPVYKLKVPQYGKATVEVVSHDTKKSIAFSPDGKATFEAVSENARKSITLTKTKNDIAESIVDLIQYINIKTLRNKYLVTSRDATTIFLKITFKDGTVKEIEDYGMNGSFGLNHLYHLLFMLSSR